MFKSKSFDLNNEENTKLPEHLYQPRRIRWMKYILIPLAIAFVLLLIICNIDFSTDQSHKNPAYSKFANWCEKLQESLHCDKNVSNLKRCTDNLLLRIENFGFPDGIISSDLFAGEYRLQGLVLSNCSLSYIENDAFDQTNLNNLLDVQLINTQLQILTQKTFRGLHKLRNFSLFNNREVMRCESFMAPLAHTLCSASIHQQYSVHSIYTPSDFFGNVIYENLKTLDLRGNNFGSTLQIDWFNNMPALESLILADCRLSSIDFDIREEHFGTLRLLDLSGNSILKLSTQLTTISMEKDIRLNLVNQKNMIDELTEMPTSIDFDVTDATEATDSIETTDLITTPKKTTTRKGPRPGTTPSTVSTPKVTEVSTPLADDFTTPLLNNTDISTFITDDVTTPSLNSTDISTPITDDVTAPSDRADIVCLNAAKDTVSNLSMVCSGQIRVVQHVESVLYVIVSHMEYDYWNIVYFSHQSSVSYVPNEDTDREPTGDITITVMDFNCTTSYLFCLLQATETTPLNCQSHHTMACASTKSSWFEAHCALIISLAIVGILLFVALGGAAMYAILWHRPTWLCGSKRLQRTARDSLTMLLLPRGYPKEVYGAIRSQNDNDSVGNYVAYYRHLEQAKLYDTESNKYNNPPQESAPPAPNSNRNTYESFDLYEELF